jgi:hypothetical protein
MLKKIQSKTIIIQYFILSMTLVCLVMSLILFLILESGSFKSFAWGAGIIYFDLIALSLLGLLIFYKNLIALAIPVIVLKYPIIGIITYKIVNLEWFAVPWFIAGIATILPASLLLLVFIKVKKLELISTTKDT